jgi:hypothetical protein
MDQPVENDRRRPITVTILAILVLIIAMANLVRFWAALQNWGTLTRLEVQPGPWYFALTGLVWGLLGCWLVWVVWRGKPGCKKAIIAISASYLLYFWLDRLVFQNHVRQLNAPFITGVVILVVFYMVLTLLLPSNQEFFSRKNEQSFKSGDS